MRPVELIGNKITFLPAIVSACSSSLRSFAITAVSFDRRYVSHQCVLSQNGRNLCPILGESTVPPRWPNASAVHIPTHRRFRTRHSVRTERRPRRTQRVPGVVDHESRKPSGIDVGSVGRYRQTFYHGLFARPNLSGDCLAMVLPARNVCRRDHSVVRSVCHRPQSHAEYRKDL